MKSDQKTKIVIAHYGLDRKISQEECERAMGSDSSQIIFIDFEAGQANLSELYDHPFETLALAQTRKFNAQIKPHLIEYPEAEIVYFGLVPVSIGFHFGFLLGNTHKFKIYQWSRSSHHWFINTTPPDKDYKFKISPLSLPLETQRGKGNVVIRVSTSFKIDQSSTQEVIGNPENDFDIQLENPNPESLYNNENIRDVVESFQLVLNAYANKLVEREQIHLFISSSAGLPFALGTRINSNIYPYIQTYQYDRSQNPQHLEAILITKEIDEKVMLSDDEIKAACAVREKWSLQLESKIKPFITAISGLKPDNWLRSVCETEEEYKGVSKLLKSPWDKVISLKSTPLIDDRIDDKTPDVDGGFVYVPKENSWKLDNGFLVGVHNRLNKDPNTDIDQAGRLFLFHEALHYSNNGHRLNRQIANGIGQFPKVIEEADYQADAWALLLDYKYCCMYDTQKLKGGLKSFFCNSIDTAVETMWSFMDNGKDINVIQIRSMNRFVNWYWQWVQIASLSGNAQLEDVIEILFQKPIIEFGGAPMKLIGHRIFYKLDLANVGGIEIATFYKNRVHRFATASIMDIVDGFRELNGKKIKDGLQSFHASLI